MSDLGQWRVTDGHASGFENGQIIELETSDEGVAIVSATDRVVVLLLRVAARIAGDALEVLEATRLVVKLTPLAGQDQLSAATKINESAQRANAANESTQA